MATVTFLYRSTRNKATLTTRLLFRESKDNDVTIGAKTSLEVSKDFWANRNNRKATATIKNEKRIVDAELAKIESHLLESFKRDFEVMEITKDWLTKELHNYYNPNNIEVKAYYLEYWFDKVIETAPKRKNAKQGVGLSYNTISGYKRVKKIVSSYQTLENTKIISLNVDWFNDFFEWLKVDDNFAYNTAVKTIDILKSVINTASKKIEIANGLNTLDIKAIDTYDIDTDVITLSFDELDEIRKIKLESDALINARKWLIIACCTGQRGVALINRIKEENFVKKGNNYTIEIKQIKGSKKVIIPVLPLVKEIYENGLPYRVSTQKLNKHFKIICQLAKIDNMVVGKLKCKKINRHVKKERPKYMYISTHVGRRSFASNHFNIIPHQAIMKVTGHKKYSTFLKYVQKDTDEHVEIFNDYYKLLEEKKEVQKNSKHLTVIKNASNQN